ncbi:tetratricopeptide repeat-containing sulfotransferase family protein [Ideonella alba]|uniref:Sulfotransferase n=1 Tax=Ideonella alba TaxID=2824118 RepID=A0A940YDJ1_9BURK|nr:tetratricopeptide repeat-containing sulfotransferase family protein [Ideonella alba]MBQ0930425.1 sulfotransferase [Ideonella alba]
MARPAAQPTPAAHDPLAAARAALARQCPPPAALRAQATALREGQSLLADLELRQHLAAHPDDADAWWLAAQASERLDRAPQAIEQLQRCLALAPGHDPARWRLVELLLRDEELAAARQHLDQLLSHQPAQALFLHHQANVLERLGQGDQVLPLVERLLATAPKQPAFQVRLGHALRVAGRSTDCVAAYRAALRLQPDCGAAWAALANLKTWRFDDADLATLRQRLGRRSLPESERPALQFALARALELRAEYAESFALYHQANRSLRARIHYDAGALQAMVDAQIQGLDEAFFARCAGQGDPSAAAIFIVGRPRSGSTLVEQMLASHPAVEGTSELPYVGHLARVLAERRSGELGPAHVRALLQQPPERWAALGQDYLRRAGAHRHSDRPRFIDKKPANVLHLGLIRAMLPNAAIVDVRRHPVATAWSMYSAYGRGALALEELGQYYRHYLRLVSHVQRLQPGRVLTLHYESLVQQPEPVLRQLLDHLGLPWDAACLRFHENTRQVLTPSSEQVRRPLDPQAVDHWRHFEPWLGPLFEALGEAADYSLPAGGTRA